MRILATAAATLLLSTAASAVTIVNGSFEDGVAIPGGQVTLATGDTTSIPGWKVLTAGIDYVGSAWDASDGVRSLDLSASTSGGISQALTDLVVNQHYQITFDVSANPDGTDGVKRLTVSATGGLAESRFYTLTEANSPTNMLYETFTYDFYASKTYGLLSFRSAVYNPFGIVLDNVAISAVPEPATWALLMAGFAFTGVQVRRRARMQSTLA